jgi:hypothetical protein
MPAQDPLATLGLRRGATVEDIRAARRRLAKAHHPDQGGDPARMQIINEAADAALLAVEAPVVQSGAAADAEPVTPAGAPGTDERGAQPEGSGTSGVSWDVPSFTVEALPVETFEAMLVVASWLGEVLDDEPPYRLDTYLREPFDCWCRLEVVPDAGASTVSLAVAGLDGAPTPDVIAVRDAWVANLNTVDWP